MAKAKSASGLLWRIGAAIVAPNAALACADRSENAGRAPTDLILLLAALFAAINLEVLVKSGYLMLHGEVLGGLQSATARIASDLQWPLLLLLVGFAAVTILAGRKRSLGADSDLACVAFVPVVAVAAAAACWRAFGLSISDVARAIAIGVASLWFAAGIYLAVRRARDRSPS